jgi:ABC-type transport system involved in multi-copper enzyme maturation permease subunit
MSGANASPGGRSHQEMSGANASPGGRSHQEMSGANAGNAMHWSLWIRQAFTVMKMELKRYVLARRWVGVYLFAFAPVALLALALIRRGTHPSIGDITEIYAVFFQTFALRLAIFFSCAMVFSQLFRGEVLEKTLHFYLLAPVRREVLMAGKYLAGVAAMSFIFGTSTILTNLLLYLHHPAWAQFFLEGNGFPNMARYFIVTIMACAAYGAVFMLTGTLFRNPAGPSILIGAWEAFFFVLPADVQKFTIMHYLQSMLPVAIDRGPFAVVADPTPAVLGIPVLLVVAGVFVWSAGQVVRRAQVTYSAD